MSRTTKNETTKNAKNTNDSSESVREQIAKQLLDDSAKMIANATEKNAESVYATARLCERLAHAIAFDMTRALKRCEKATRNVKLSKTVREYLRDRFATLSRI